MFTHDPYQNYATWGVYPGATPFGLPYSPYTAQQNPGMNPAAFGQGSGIPGYGVLSPQHLQALLATQAAIQQQLQNPLLAAVYQNPLLAPTLQNQLTANPMQHPLAAALLQNPLLNPILAQTGIPTLPQGGQQNHPLLQQIGQFGGLQPQSWAGQGGMGGGQQFGPQQYGPQQYGPQQYGPQQFGAIHPLLAQLSARLGQTPGINPWGGY